MYLYVVNFSLRLPDGRMSVSGRVEVITEALSMFEVDRQVKEFVASKIPGENFQIGTEILYASVAHPSLKQGCSLVAQ